MVRPTTQQKVDRIVGTVVVLGLSITVIRWLSHMAHRRHRYKRLPLWWLVVFIQRWRERRKKHPSGTSEQDRTDLKLKEAREKNRQGAYEYRGSCQCGVIYFRLRGPQHLEAIDSPGKIRYPHVPTTASQFSLLRGENEMRFYYVEDNIDSVSIVTSSTISDDRNNRGTNEVENQTNRNHAQQQSSGAHGFCGSCGVHILRAPSRSSEDLEINAYCLEDKRESSSNKKRSTISSFLKSSSSSLTSSGAENEGNNNQGKVRCSLIETVDENKAYLGENLQLWENLDDRSAHPETTAAKFLPVTLASESGSIHETQPLTHSVSENDEYSMASSSITGTSSLHMAISVASGAAGTLSKQNKNGVPPAYPSSGISIKTLPPRFVEQPNTACVGGRSLTVGRSNWSTASLESSDLDGETSKTSSISPKMLKQMKYYMRQHMSSKET